MVDCHGSVLLQPRGSGPADPVLVAVVGAYLVIVSQVFTTPRPVLEPTCAVRPPRRRAFAVSSRPSQWLSRSAPRSLSRTRNGMAAIAFAAAVGAYTVTG